MMETVFDHDPTDEELLYLFGSPEAVKCVKADPCPVQDTAYSIIASLYDLRGDALSRDAYVGRIRDRETRVGTIIQMFSNR